MAKIPVAVQIFSVRHEYQADLRGTLAKVAAMGYEGVDFFGNPPLPAKELRDILDDLSLKVAGWHVGYQKLEANSIEETIAYHHELGNHFLIVPGLPKDRVTSHADMLHWAGWLDGVERRNWLRTAWRRAITAMVATMWILMVTRFGMSSFRRQAKTS